MAKNIRVIGGYKCGCTYGPAWQKDRLEYCGVHGDEIANEYEVPSKAHLTMLAPDVCHESSDGKHQWYQGSVWEICAHCGTRR